LRKSLLVILAAHDTTDDEIDLTLAQTTKLLQAAPP
jgi:hypothetical protein